MGDAWKTWSYIGRVIGYLDKLSIHIVKMLESY